jgi:16S rRNA (cytosine967-C5)-methyltransferase
VLVYSTCSLEPEEGEAQAERALSELPLALEPVEEGEAFGLAEPAAPPGALRTLPSALRRPEERLSGLDGFYIARFRRL